MESRQFAGNEQQTKKGTVENWLGQIVVINNKMDRLFHSLNFYYIFVPEKLLGLLEEQTSGF